MSALRKGSCLCAFVSLVLLGLLQEAGGQPPKTPPKWPAIAPDKARLEQTFRGLDGPGQALAVSEHALMVAAACDQHTIQLWHKDCLLGLRDGSNTVNVLTGHNSSVLALAWVGNTLASAAADKKLLLWEMPQEKILHTLDSPFLVRTIALSPDGKTLAAAGDNATIQLWDVDKGKAARELKGHADWVLCLHFSEDGKQMLSGGYESNALLWDVAEGKKLRELPAPPKMPPKTPPDPDPVTAVTFSPDAKQILLGHASGSIDQINASDGQKVREFTGHTSAVTAVLFHPSGTLAVSSSKDGSIRLWNPTNGTLVKALTDHTAWVEGVALLAEGTRLVSVGADQTVRVWNLTAP